MQIPCTLVTAIMRPNRRPSQGSSAPPLPVRGLPVVPAAAGSTYANIIAWGQGNMDDHDYENDPTEDTPSPVSPGPAAAAAAAPTLSLESLHSALPSRGPGGSGALPRARATSSAAQLRASAHMYGNVATVGDDDEELPSPPPPKGGTTTYAPALTRAAAAAAAAATAAATSVSALGRTPAPAPPPSDDHDYENYDPTTDGPPAAPARPALPPGRQTSGSSYEDTGAVPAGARPVSLPRPEVRFCFLPTQLIKSSCFN